LYQDDDRAGITLVKTKNKRGCTRIASLSDYATVGDSISLKQIDGKNFTIIGIEDSDYTQGDEITKGVKITTEEDFNGMSKFHTTRIAIVNKLGNPTLREDIKKGLKLKVKVITSQTKKGKDFFELVDAVAETKQEKI